MTSRFKRILMAVAVAHAVIAVGIGIASGDWVAGLGVSGLVFVFLTGFPLMFLAGLDGDER